MWPVGKSQRSVNFGYNLMRILEWSTIISWAIWIDCVRRPVHPSQLCVSRIALVSILIHVNIVLCFPWWFIPFAWLSFTEFLTLNTLCFVCNNPQDNPGQGTINVGWWIQGLRWPPTSQVTLTGVFRRWGNACITCRPSAPSNQSSTQSAPWGYQGKETVSWSFICSVLSLILLQMNYLYCNYVYEIVKLFTSVQWLISVNN